METAYRGMIKNIFIFNYSFLIRYYSSNQDNMNNGLMVHWYIQLFDTLNAYYTERSPSLTFEVKDKCNH